MIQTMLLGTVWCALAAGPADAAGPHPRRLIYNMDAGANFSHPTPPMKPEDVFPCVDEVADKGVTTYFICPNYGMPLTYRTKVSEMVGDGLSEERWKQLREIAALKPGSLERGIVNLRALAEAGHDPLRLIIERARARKLETFVTFRMNEIHDVQQADSLLHTKFWREHPEWRVGKIGDPVSELFVDIIGGTPGYRVSPIVATWFPGALNFAVPQVRDLEMAELRECCERFPIDGLDLDFQRFPIYFPQDQGRQHIETMTAWVREIRQMTREVGLRRGRPLLLSARVLARPKQNLDIGLDPVTWARERLLDFVTVSHYLRNDFPLPVGEYKKLIPDIPVYASIEVCRQADDYGPIARQLWSDGADGLLMFNFFTWREGGREPPFHVLKELAALNRTAGSSKPSD